MESEGFEIFYECWQKILDFYVRMKGFCYLQFSKQYVFYIYVGFFCFISFVGVIQSDFGESYVCSVFVLQIIYIKFKEIEFLYLVIS